MGRTGNIYFSMTPVTSLDDHSPVNPSHGVHPTTEEDDSRSDIGEIDYYNCDHFEGCGENKSYNPEYIGIDGAYDQSIKVPFIFTNRLIL